MGQGSSWNKSGERGRDQITAGHRKTREVFLYLVLRAVGCMGGEGAKGEQALFPLKKKVHFALM